MDRQIFNFPNKSFSKVRQYEDGKKSSFIHKVLFLKHLQNVFWKQYCFMSLPWPSSIPILTWCWCGSNIIYLTGGLFGNVYVVPLRWVSSCRWYNKSLLFRIIVFQPFVDQSWEKAQSQIHLLHGRNALLLL